MINITTERQRASFARLKPAFGSGLFLLNSLLLGVIALFPVTAGAVCPTYQTGQVAGTVQTEDLTEASGIAASRRNPGVLWVHNDSGDTARIFAMTPGGALLGTYSLQSVAAVDWEDIAIGPGPAAGVHYIYIGDIGDNAAGRSSIRVYRIPEPAVNPAQSPVTVTITNWERVTLRYEDGARNAESLLIDPANGDLYIITKETPSRLYHAPAPLSTSATLVMDHLLTLGFSLATGADVAVNGNEILVRRYPNATLWQRPPGSAFQDAFTSPVCAVPVAIEAQGEAIAFDHLGGDYYTIGEGQFQPIYRYNRTSPSMAQGLWLTY